MESVAVEKDEECPVLGVRAMSPGTARFINEPSKAGLECSGSIIAMGLSLGPCGSAPLRGAFERCLNQCGLSVELCLSPDPMIFIPATSCPRANNEDEAWRVC